MSPPSPCCRPPARPPRKRSPFTVFFVGNWVGTARGDSATGAFRGCQIDARFGDGLILSIVLTTKGARALVLTDERWRLERNKSYSIGLAIDATDLGTVTAVAAASETLIIDLGGKPEVLPSLRYARDLRIRATQRDFVLDVENSAEALDRPEACFKRGGAPPADSGANPFAGPETATRDEPPGTEEQAALAAELRQWLGMLFRKVGVAGAEFLDPAVLEIPRASLAWWVPEDVTGFLVLLPSDDQPVERSVHRVFREFSGGCESALALVAVAVPTAGDADKIFDVEVGRWHGGAFRSDETGAFRGCSIESEYTSGITLTLACCVTTPS